MKNFTYITYLVLILMSCNKRQYGNFNNSATIQRSVSVPVSRPSFEPFKPLSVSTLTTVPPTAIYERHKMAENKKISEIQIIKNTLKKQQAIKKKTLVLSIDSTKTSRAESIKKALTKEEKMAVKSLAFGIISLFLFNIITLFVSSYFMYVIATIIFFFAITAFLKGDNALKYNLSKKYMKYAKIGKKLGLIMIMTILVSLLALLYLLYALRDWDLTFGS